MKIIHISDTHSHIIKNMPEADLLVHSGDATLNGGPRELRTFNFWLESIRHKYKEIIFVPGNHDRLFEEDEAAARSVVTAARVLIDEAYEFEGFKIYGTPYTPAFFQWAFMKFRGEEMRHVWNKVPLDTNILISHGPPRNILDECYQDGRIKFVGCDDMLKRIEELKDLKLCMFGHIHPAYGKMFKNGVTYSNGSTTGPFGMSFNAPLEIVL